MLRRLLLSATLAIFVCVLLGYLGYRILERQHPGDSPITKRQDISVTIIEGKRREEIAAILQQNGITTAQDFLTASAGDEGQLFPDTYRFFPDTPAATIVATMRDTYRNRLGSNLPTATELIIASIVEREAATDAERPLIAGVYYNRIRSGMALQADPTVQYAKDSQTISPLAPEKAYWSPITQADYHGVISTYNTYLSADLPPGPICNPGKKSIEAAMQPAQHDYYYFFQRNGQIYLSRTLEEHQAKLQSTL